MILMAHVAEAEPSDKVLSKRDLSWFWWDHAQSSSTTPLRTTLVTTSQSQSTRSMLAQLAHEDFLDSGSGNCPLSCLFVVCGHEEGPRMKEESSLRRFFKKATALPTNRTTKEDKDKVVYLPEDLPLNEDFYDIYCSTTVSPPQVFESLPMAFFIGGVHCFLQCINAFLPGRASAISTKMTTLSLESSTFPTSTAPDVTISTFPEFTLHPDENLTASTNSSASELMTTGGEYAGPTTIIQNVDISSTELYKIKEMPISENDTLNNNNVSLNFSNDNLPSGEPMYYESPNATESAETSLTGKVEFYELPPVLNELASSSTALLYDIPTMSNNQIYDHIQRMKSTSTTPHPIFIINNTNLTTEFLPNVSFPTEIWKENMPMTPQMRDSKVAGFFKNIKMKLSKDLNPKKGLAKTSQSPDGETITHPLDSAGSNCSEQLFDPNTAYGKGVVEMFLHYFRNWMGTFASTKYISKDNILPNETTPMFNLISLDTAHLTKTVPQEDTSSIQSNFVETLTTISKNISLNDTIESVTSNSIDYSSISTESYSTQSRIGILDLYTYILPLHIPENYTDFQLVTSVNSSDSVDARITTDNVKHVQLKELQSQEQIQIYEIPPMGGLFQENETTISQFFEISQISRFKDYENVNTIQPEKHLNLSEDERFLAKSTKHYKNKHGILHKVNDSRAANFLKNMLGISREPTLRTVCDSATIKPTQCFSMKMLKKGDIKNADSRLREGEKLESVGTEGRAPQTIASPVNKMRLKRRRYKRDLRDPYRFHLTYGLYPMDKAAFSQALARSAHVLKEMKSPPIPRMAWNTRRKESEMDFGRLVQRRRFSRNESAVQKRSWMDGRRPANMGEKLKRYPRRLSRNYHVSGFDPKPNSVKW